MPDVVLVEYEAGLRFGHQDEIHPTLSLMGRGRFIKELEMTSDGHFKVPTPVNEPVRQYAPGDPYRKTLKARLAELTDASPEVPMKIAGARRWGASRAEIRSA